MFFLNQVGTVLEMGFIYAVVALGVYITYKILDFPDLSVDGTFPLGGVVFSVLLTAGCPWAVAMVASFAAGCAAGLVTGLLHVKLKINGLLSGIITMTALLSVNYLIAGGPMVSFAKETTLLQNGFVNGFDRLGAAYIQVVQAFGQKILDAEGEIDRKRLAAEVFQDADKMEQLNACVHPEVYLWLRETILHLKAQGKIQVAVVEAALEKELEEAGVCDAIWYVHASEPVRRKRLKASRGYTDEKIDAMFASQMSEADFRKACSVVIDNNGSLEDVQRQLAGLFGAF